MLAAVCRPRKQMPSDPIQAMEFAQSKGRARKDGRTGVTFGDIAGMEATKTELQEIVQARRDTMRRCESIDGFQALGGALGAVC